MLLSEDVLWSYICQVQLPCSLLGWGSRLAPTQLASALRAIHAEGLACRCLYPSKILVTGKNRIRINGVGVADVSVAVVV